MSLAMLSRPIFTRSRAPLRAVVAGTAWGLTLGIGLTTIGYVNCGVVCVPDALLTTGISIVAGVAAMGPLAALSPSRLHAAI